MINILFVVAIAKTVALVLIFAVNVWMLLRWIERAHQHDKCHDCVYRRKKWANPRSKEYYCDIKQMSLHITPMVCNDHRPRSDLN